MLPTVAAARVFRTRTISEKPRQLPVTIGRTYSSPPSLGICPSARAGGSSATRVDPFEKRVPFGAPHYPGIASPTPKGSESFQTPLRASGNFHGKHFAAY